eukprot:g64599.t1
MGPVRGYQAINLRREHSSQALETIFPSLLRVPDQRTHYLPTKHSFRGTSPWTLSNPSLQSRYPGPTVVDQLTLRPE